MSGIKKLAGQTLWYGASSVLAKMLNFLLTPILTYLMVDNKGMSEFGDFSLLYAWIAVANVVFTYGLETGYFRYSNQPGVEAKSLFNTGFASHVVSTMILCGVLLYFNAPISRFLEISKLPQVVIITILIIGFDTLATIPFAKLRQENKPRKYAFIKVFGVAINIFLVLLLLYVLPKYFADSSSSFIKWILGQNRVTLLVLANLLQSAFVFILLYAEWRQFKFEFNSKLWRTVMSYSMPLIIIGLAGMINEVMDRQFLLSLLPHSVTENKQIVGIYSANYKISIFITMFIQAFRMAGEPFFFKQKNAQNAPFIYAKVMKWFVLVLCIAFLFTALYLHVWQYMISKNYRTGLYIVPYLLLANVFLGIYYNLSVWYKITDKMYWGIIITLIGAVVTLAGNYFFIPKYEMYAASITTMVCYGLMVYLAYKIGQKYYPIPYAWKKLTAYIVISLLVFLLCQLINSYMDRFWIKTFISTIFMLAFLLFVANIEKKELQKLPFIGRFLK